MRFNHLVPPFDNPALRRAIIGAVSQSDYMIGMVGTDVNSGVARYSFDTPGQARQRDSRLIPTTSVDAGMVFERDSAWFGRAQRQTLEPRLLYVNTPYRDQTGLPNFDAAERDFNAVSIYAENAFSDGFPLLVASTASLDELNRRLVAAGQAPVTMQRFRPNLVLDGLEQPHDEDLIDELVIDTPDGPVRLRLVKPCARCGIPDVDPATGEPDGAVGTVLAGYRIDPRVDGGITFGMNAVIVEGVGRTLRVGASVSARFAV